MSRMERILDNTVCLDKPDKYRCIRSNQTNTVASDPTVPGSVFMRSLRLFFGQCVCVARIVGLKGDLVVDLG